MTKQPGPLQVHREVLIWVAFALPITGCAPSPSSAVNSGTIITYLGDSPAVQTSIEYVGLDDKIVLVIWTDVVGSSDSKSASSDDGILLHGELNSGDGRRLIWKCNAQADGAGTLTIDEAKYDLDNGFIFLVSKTDGRSKIRQVNREEVAVSNVNRDVRELAKEQELTTFFSQPPDNGI